MLCYIFYTKLNKLILSWDLAPYGCLILGSVKMYLFLLLVSFFKLSEHSYPAKILELPSIMSEYSRNFLLSLNNWWKSTTQSTQESRHCIQRQWTRPVSECVWQKLKTNGILRKTRGKRGGETTKYSGSFSAMNRHSQRANLATSIPEITQGSQIQTTVIRNGNDVVP